MGAAWEIPETLANVKATNAIAKAVLVIAILLGTTFCSPMTFHRNNVAVP